MIFAFNFIAWFWDLNGIQHSELENEGREEENEEKNRERQNGGMNFAVVWQNSFVWFIVHAYTHEILVHTCFLWYWKNNGMMKDSFQNSLQGGHFETQMNQLWFLPSGKTDNTWQLILNQTDLWWRTATRVITSFCIHLKYKIRYKIEEHPKLHWILPDMVHTGYTIIME